MDDPKGNLLKDVYVPPEGKAEIEKWSVYEVDNGKVAYHEGPKVTQAELDSAIKTLLEELPKASEKTRQWVIEELRWILNDIRNS